MVEAIEPPDFDTRPGEPLRSTIAAWVASCRFCTYCAADMTVAHSKAHEVDPQRFVPANVPR